MLLFVANRGNLLIPVGQDRLSVILTFLSSIKIRGREKLSGEPTKSRPTLTVRFIEVISLILTSITEVIQQNPNQSTHSGLHNALLHQREGLYPTSFKTIGKTRPKMLEQGVYETSFYYFTLPFCDSKVFSSVYVVSKILTPSSHKPNPTWIVYYQEMPNQYPTKMSAISIHFPNAVKNPINFHSNFLQPPLYCPPAGQLGGMSPS